MNELLAHGGVGGALIEGAVLMVPIAAFALLARAGRRREAARAATGDDPRSAPPPSMSDPSGRSTAGPAPAGR
ncbi:MAG: hypothetical protein ACT4OS_00445 [Acidimicrobiales bacterium]